MLFERICSQALPYFLSPLSFIMRRAEYTPKYRKELE